MTDPRTSRGALKTVALGIGASIALEVLGFVGQGVLPGAWGEAAKGFFSMLATGAFSLSVAPLFWQKQMSAAALFGSLRFCLALATGVAIIVYVEASGGGLSAIDIAITIAAILALLPMMVSWVRLLQREAAAQRGLDAHPS